MAQEDSSNQRLDSIVHGRLVDTSPSCSSENPSGVWKNLFALRLMRNPRMDLGTASVDDRGGPSARHGEHVRRITQKT